MKTTSIRLKVSVHIDIIRKPTEPAISHPQAGSDPELFQQKEHRVLEAATKLAAAPSTPRAVRKLQWLYPSLLFRRLLCRLKLQPVQSQYSLAWLRLAELHQLKAFVLPEGVDFKTKHGMQRLTICCRKLHWTQRFVCRSVWCHGSSL